MKLKSVVISLIALGISSPLLAAGLYDSGAVAYQQAVMRDQSNKIDLILDQINPVASISPVVGYAVLM